MFGRVRGGYTCGSWRNADGGALGTVVQPNAGLDVASCNVDHPMACFARAIERRE